MTLRTPPSWLQNGSHPAENDRLTMQGIIATTGTYTSASLGVTQSGTPGMSVVVASGWGAIIGNYTTNMGAYNFFNDANATLSVTTANPSNPRIDKVVVTINDSYYTGVLDNVTFTVLAGTPAVSPVAPATPTNSLVLATIAVGAGVTSIVNANITDARVLLTTNLPVGDITDVTAGTGLSGGGSSGSVTVSLDTASVYVVPSQTSNSGKALTTNGTVSSWSTTINGTAIPASKTLVATDSTTYVVPSQTSNSGKYLTTNGSVSSWAAITTDPTPTVFLLMGA